MSDRHITTPAGDGRPSQSDRSPRPCGCPANPGATITDEPRHDAWHRQIAPLTRADAVTLERAYGWPAGRVRTFIDDQFDAARGIARPRTENAMRQIVAASWLEQFHAAVRTVPVGTELTTADIHALVPPPPHPNAWGGATTAAKKLGLIRAITVQQSDLDTTKSSLVRRWLRIDERSVSQVSGYREAS